MGIANMGMGAGRGVMGYYEGKNARNKSEKTDYEMDRDEMLDRALDPLTIKKAKADTEIRERQNALGEKTHEYDVNRARYQDKRLGREDKFDSASMPGRVKGIGYRDNAAERADNASQHAAQYDNANTDMAQSGILRAHNQSEYAKKNDNKNTDIGQRVLERGDVLGGQIATQQTQMFDTEQSIRAAEDTIQNAATLKDPALLADFYNNDDFFPDDNDVTITRIEGTEDGYLITPRRGDPQETTGQEMMRSFQETFLNPQTYQRLDGRGSVDPRSSRGSRYGRGQQSTGNERAVDDIEQLLHQMPENQGRNPAEVRLEAYQLAAQRGTLPPEVLAKEAYAELLETYANNPLSVPDGETPESMAEAGAQSIYQYDPTVGNAGAVRSVDDILNNAMGSQRD